MRYDPILCMMVDDSVKTHDVAPATQRYINTIVHENKANAEKFVRQAEHDDEVPENELKYVYKAYNEKFGYKFHDSVETKDAMFVQLRFSSGRTEGAKLEENEYREYAEALLKKYGEKMVTLSKNGKAIATYMNRSKLFNDSNTIDKAIRSCDRVTVKYDDAIGDTHTFFKETEEEAKKWIDQGKFPHGAAFNVKIDGKLYKKEAR